MQTEEVMTPPGVCPLSDDEVVDMIMKFLEAFSNVRLYAYQYVFIRRAVEAILLMEGVEITGLWSRQCGKCLARGTPVLMYDGRIKPVEEVRIGDLVMGDDSTPRTVQSLSQGRSKMYQITPKSNCHEPYVVNENHILTLARKRLGSSALRPRPCEWETIDIPVKEAAERLTRSSESLMGVKATVEFEESPVPIDPYWFGLWLGDGCARSTKITTMDPEIVEFLHEYADKLGMRVGKYEDQNSRADTYAIVNFEPSRSKPNYLQKALEDLGVLEDKHIPHAYLANSRDVRLKVLAGLIDSDGHRPKADHAKNICEITQKSLELAENIQWLSRSLGMRASLKAKYVNEVPYYRVCIYGDLSEVPTGLPRKQYEKTELKDDPLRYGISITELEDGDYFGFELDGNKRFLLGDLTVTHNSEAVSILCVGLAIILPCLSNAFPGDPRFLPYRKGFDIGIYAPIERQAKIPYARMRAMVTCKHGRAILSDPELGITVDTNRADLLVLSNGSKILARTASEESQLEGETHDLVVLEEAQKLSRAKVEKEISPMLASRNGSMIKIGTAFASRGGFHTTIQRNVEERRRGGKRNHFEFPYDVVIKEKRATYDKEVEETGVGNPLHLAYEAKINSEIKKMGGVLSDEFKMNYCCLWLESRLQAFRLEIIAGAKVTSLEAGPSRHGFQVAGLDIGKTNDSTVLTTMLVDRSKPVVNLNSLPGADEDKQLYYNKMILDWVEFSGNFEGVHGQYNMLIDYLKMTNVKVLAIDASSMGNPVFERIEALVGGQITCVPIVFGTVSKHDLYKYYRQEVNAGRVKYPAGIYTQQRQEYMSFVKQHEVLEAVTKGNYVLCEAPEDEHDDFPDSAALACWAEKVADEVMIPEVEVSSGFSHQGGGRHHSSGRAGRYARGR